MFCSIYRPSTLLLLAILINGAVPCLSAQDVSAADPPSPVNNEDQEPVPVDFNPVISVPQLGPVTAEANSAQPFPAESRQVLHDADGNASAPIPRTREALTTALKASKGIWVMMGSRNIVLPIFATADPDIVAARILEKIGQQADVELFSLDGDVWIKTPQEDFKKPEVQYASEIVQTIIDAQAGESRPAVALETGPSPPAATVVPADKTQDAQPNAASVIIIETTPDIERSEVIRQVVDALEKNGQAKRGEVNPAGKPIGYSATMFVRRDTPYQKAKQLVEALKSLSMNQLKFSAVGNGEFEQNSVVVQCPADVSWRRVRTITDTLEKLGDVHVDVRVFEPRSTTQGASPANGQDSVSPPKPAIRSPFERDDLTTADSQQPPVTVIYLKFADASTVARTLQQLGQQNVVVEERLNALLIRCEGAQLEEIEQLLQVLDTADSPTQNSVVDGHGSQQPSKSRPGGFGGGGPPFGNGRKSKNSSGDSPVPVDVKLPMASGNSTNDGVFSFSIGISRNPETDLRARQQSLDQKSRELATRLRGPLPDPATGDLLKSELQNAVREAFQARQELQRAELAEFARRLKGIQESIETRDRISQQIIDRRIEELLDPNLKWEETQATSGRAQALRSDSAEVPKTTSPDGSRRAASETQSNSTMASLTDGVLVKTPDELHKLLARVADERKAIESAIRLCEKDRNAGKGDALIEGRIEELQRQLVEQKGKQAHAQQEYLEQIKLLEAVLQRDRARLEQADEAMRSIELLSAKGYKSPEEVRECALQQQEARVALQRSESLLKLYRQAGEGFVPSSDVETSNNDSANSDSSSSPSPSSVGSSLPNVPGKRPATTIKERMQGRWIVESVIIENDETVATMSEQMICQIEGNIMQHTVGGLDYEGPILLADCEDIDSSQVDADGPLPIDLVFDPNDDSARKYRGIVACDGETMSICIAGDPAFKPKDDFRPTVLAAGSKVTLWKCRAPIDAAGAEDVSAEDSPMTTPDGLRRAANDSLGATPSDEHASEQTIRLDLALSHQFQIHWSGRMERTPTSASFDVPADVPSRVVLDEIMRQHGLEIALAIEPTGNASSSKFVERSPQVRVQLKEHELALLSDGKPITLAAVLSSSANLTNGYYPAAVVNLDIDNSIDPLLTAEAQGTVIAVIKITDQKRAVTPIKNVEELNGTWRLVKADLVSDQPSGLPFHDVENYKSSRITISDSDWQYVREGSPPRQLSATYNLDASPQTVDLKYTFRDAEKHDWRIFELHGDTLITARRTTAANICPSSFDEPMLLIEKYQRVGVVTVESQAYSDLITISLGTADGILVKQRLQVSDGSSVLGMVEIVTVREYESDARVVEWTADRSIRKGDRVKPMQSPDQVKVPGTDDSSNSAIEGHVITSTEEWVEIAMGQNDGVKVGMTFVVSHKGLYRGVIEITSLSADQSVGRIIPQYNGEPIAAGDKAVRRINVDPKQIRKPAEIPARWHRWEIRLPNESKQFDRFFDSFGIGFGLADVGGREIMMLFYSEEADQLLSTLEAKFANGKPIEQIEKTVFGVRPQGDGFDLDVISQSVKPPAENSDTEPTDAQSKEEKVSETDKSYSRENRWEVRYPNDPKQFGRALDYFGVELGSADGDTKEITYLSSLNAGKLAVRRDLCARESRLFLTEADGESIHLAKTFLDQAGIETQVRLVMWFYSDETALLLADLEAKFDDDKPIELVEKTVFGVRPKAGGFEFYVISQTIKPSATSKNGALDESAHPFEQFVVPKTSKVFTLDEVYKEIPTDAVTVEFRVLSESVHYTDRYAKINNSQAKPLILDSNKPTVGESGSYLVVAVVNEALDAVKDHEPGFFKNKVVRATGFVRKENERWEVGRRMRYEIVVRDPKHLEIVSDESEITGADSNSAGDNVPGPDDSLRGAASDAQPTLGKTLNQLQGKWRLTRQVADDGDESITPSNATWEFKGNRVIARDSGGGGAMIVTIEESHSPVHVDVELETEEETGLGLLSLEGDLLKVCLGKSQKEPDPRSRPEKLEAVRGAWYMELRRMEPGETIAPSQPTKQPPGVSGETPNAHSTDLDAVDASIKIANASSNMKLAEICSQAHAALTSIETLQYRFEKKDHQGWQSHAEFYADQIRFRVNRKDVTGIMSLDDDLKPIRNPPMTISSAFDGQKQQYARQNEPVRVKHGREGGSYGITIPQVWAYGWLRDGAAEFHWDTILSKERWEQRFLDAIYIGEVTEDGRRFEIVDFQQRLQQVTPCIYRVYFARDLAFLPLKIFRNTLNRNEPSTTIHVTRFKTFTVNGKQIAIPLDIQHRETQADGVSHKGETTITVDESSLRVNEPLDDSLFTLDDVDEPSAAIEYSPSRVEDGPPPWLKEYPFRTRKFTFVRLRYAEPAGRWSTDYPDADINLSDRVKQLTRLDVAPEGLVMDVADPELAAHPLAYLSANGRWQLSDEDATALRSYLNGGGFLMIDDSWGPAELANIVAQLKKVLPERQLSELPLEHALFHCVYDLQEKPQVCGIHYANAGRENGVTWERDDAKTVSYQGITDDQERLMVLVCHNTDLADGWERVNVDAWYAREFSEKRAFPMGVNIIFHVVSSAE